MHETLKEVNNFKNPYLRNAHAPDLPLDHAKRYSALVHLSESQGWEMLLASIGTPALPPPCVAGLGSFALGHVSRGG